MRSFFDASTGRRAYVDARYYAHSHIHAHPFDGCKPPVRGSAMKRNAHTSAPRERARIRRVAYAPTHARTHVRALDRRVDENNSLPFLLITISSFSLLRVSYLSRFRYIISLLPTVLFPVSLSISLSPSRRASFTCPPFAVSVRLCAHPKSTRERERKPQSTGSHEENRTE